MSSNLVHFNLNDGDEGIVVTFETASAAKSVFLTASCAVDGSIRCYKYFKPICK